MRKVITGVLLLVALVVMNICPAEAHTILTKKGGVNYYDDGFGPHKETWYNLPMDRVVRIAHEKGIKGEYWETEEGEKMIGYFIICAADYSVHPYGSIVLTSRGPAKVIDTGAFTQTNPTQVDIAVNWR